MLLTASEAVIPLSQNGKACRFQQEVGPCVIFSGIPRVIVRLVGFSSSIMQVGFLKCKKKGKEGQEAEEREKEQGESTPQTASVDRSLSEQADAKIFDFTQIVNCGNFFGHERYL